MEVVMKYLFFLLTLSILIGCNKQQKTEPANQKSLTVASITKNRTIIDNKKQATALSANEMKFLTKDSEPVTHNNKLTKREVRVISEQELVNLNSSFVSTQPRKRGVMSYVEAIQQRPDLLRDTGKYDNRDKSDYQAQANFSSQQMSDRQDQLTRDLQQNNQRFQREMQARQDELQRERERRKQELIKEISKPIPGANGLTASQRDQIVALETGQQIPNRSTAQTPSNNSPKYISNCDGSGCWGTNGTRYNNSGTGNYYSSDGKFCQSIGGQMQCN